MQSTAPLPVASKVYTRALLPCPGLTVTPYVPKPPIAEPHPVSLTPLPHFHLTSLVPLARYSSCTAHTPHPYHATAPARALHTHTRAPLPRAPRWLRCPMRDVGPRPAAPQGPPQCQAQGVRGVRGPGGWVPAAPSRRVLGGTRLGQVRVGQVVAREEFGLQ